MTGESEMHARLESAQQCMDHTLREVVFGHWSEPVGSGQLSSAMCGRLMPLHNLRRWHGEPVMKLHLKLRNLQSLSITEEM